MRIVIRKPGVRFWSVSVYASIFPGRCAHAWFNSRREVWDFIRECVAEVAQVSTPKARAA